MPNSLTVLSNQSLSKEVTDEQKKVHNLLRCSVEWMFREKQPIQCLIRLDKQET